MGEKESEEHRGSQGSGSPHSSNPGSQRADPASLKALADELAKDGAEELNSGMINVMKLERRHVKSQNSVRHLRRASLT